MVIANTNIIFVAGLGGIGLDTSREIVKRGPKVGNNNLWVVTNALIKNNFI